MSNSSAQMGHISSSGAFFSIVIGALIVAYHNASSEYQLWPIVGAIAPHSPQIGSTGSASIDYRNLGKI